MIRINSYQICQKYTTGFQNATPFKCQKFFKLIVVEMVGRNVHCSMQLPSRPNMNCAKRLTKDAILGLGEVCAEFFTNVDVIQPDKKSIFRTPIKMTFLGKKTGWWTHRQRWATYFPHPRWVCLVLPVFCGTFSRFGDSLTILMILTDDKFWYGH